MHTLWVRLNAVVFFGLTVLLCLSGLAALSKLGHSLRQQPREFSLPLCPWVCRHGTAVVVVYNAQGSHRLDYSLLCAVLLVLSNCK
jgi:hypothetical protein